MERDEEHLRLLVIGHYVYAAVMALVSCFPLIHVTVGLVIMFNPPAPAAGDPFPAEAFGALFATVGAVLVLAGWTLATCVFFAGRSIRARKRFTFCMVVAAICCVLFPFGTVLGVLSILVLQRPAVRDLFRGGAPMLTAPPLGVPQPGAWRDESFAEPSRRD